MARIARIIGVGYPHHIIQRGNNREKVFCDEQDRDIYLKLLAKYCLENRVTINAYCLMTNHIHILAVPNNEDSLSKMMQKVSLVYTQQFNKKYKRTGRLWECRYHSCLVDEENYLWIVCSYIENNPVRAGIKTKAELYKWSSVGVNIGRQKEHSFVSSVWGTDKEKEDYRYFLNKDISEVERNLIKQKTYTGKPLGDANFVEKINKVFGFKLNFRLRGRPKKEIKK